MKIALIGATGLVGKEILHILEERPNLPQHSLIPVASPGSLNTIIQYRDQVYEILGVKQALQAKPDVALFATGEFDSKIWTSSFTEKGATVIDNSTAWRMHPDYRLIIPEVNGHLLTAEDKVIANPNCTAIQLIMALHPIYQQYGLQRLVISTYQSVTGAGKKAVDQLLGERQGEVRVSQEVPYPIDFNVIPHIGKVLDNHYTDEEMKVVNETHKILQDPNIGITVTAVRVPTLGGHALSVNATLASDFELQDIIALLEKTPGLVVQNHHTARKPYTTPIDVRNKDEVFVSRIRIDESQPRTLNMWIVADNLRKGAATNAIQIMEYLLEKGMLARS